MTNEITIRDYVDTRLSDLKEHLTERAGTAERTLVSTTLALKESTAEQLKAGKEAVAKAEDAQRVVNETQNEFRSTLKDQAATLMPRLETEKLISGLQKDITDLKTNNSERRGSDHGRGLQTAHIITIVTIIMSAGSLILIATR